MTLQKLFLSFGGTGLSPKSPDIIATLTALLTGVVILHYFGMETLFMLAFATTVIGILEINKQEKATGEHCPSYIVIDKAAGVWLTLMIAISTASAMTYPYAIVLATVLSFASFYLFYTWKPSTIGWIERELKGGLGVMLSKVLAGIAGGFLAVVILMAVEKFLF